MSPPGRAWLLAGALAGVGLLLLAAVALGAEPTALPLELLEGGDPRSEGAGPGIVGSPLLIVAGVIALGLLTAVATLIVARFLARD